MAKKVKPRVKVPKKAAAGENVIDDKLDPAVSTDPYFQIGAKYGKFQIGAKYGKAEVKATWRNDDVSVKIITSALALCLVCVAAAALSQMTNNLRS